METVTISETLGYCSKLKRFIDQKSLDNYTPATKMEAAKWKHESINTWLPFLFRVGYTCRDSDRIVASPAGNQTDSLSLPQGLRPILCLVCRDSDRFSASLVGNQAESLPRLQGLGQILCVTCRDSSRIYCLTVSASAPNWFRLNKTISKHVSCACLPAVQICISVVLLLRTLQILCICVCIYIYIYN